MDWFFDSAYHLSCPCDSLRTIKMYIVGNPNLMIGYDMCRPFIHQLQIFLCVTCIHHANDINRLEQLKEI